MLEERVEPGVVPPVHAGGRFVPEGRADGEPTNPNNLFRPAGGAGRGPATWLRPAAGSPAARDDGQVREAVRFYRALQRRGDDRAQAKLSGKMPSLYQAWQLYQEPSWEAWVLEAHLLAGEETRVIAQKCGLHVDVVDVYHDVFFDVRDRLRAHDWVLCRVIGPRVSQRFRESDRDVLLKLYGFLGGPLVLDGLVEYLQDPDIALPPLDGLDQAGLGDLHLRLAIRASILARVCPLIPPRSPV